MEGRYKGGRWNVEEGRVGRWKGGVEGEWKVEPSLHSSSRPSPRLPLGGKGVEGRKEGSKLEGRAGRRKGAVEGGTIRRHTAPILLDFNLQAYTASILN